MEFRSCAYVLRHAAVVVVFRFKSQDGEDGYGGVQRGGAVDNSYQKGVSLTVVSDKCRTELKTRDSLSLSVCVCLGSCMLTFLRCSWRKQ